MSLKTHILRLGSVVPHGVGGPQAGALDLIYAFLLQEYGQTAYTYIHVNQIGEDLNELIQKQGKHIHINIRYTVYEDFEQKNEEEQNRIRLDVAHLALLRIAEQDKKLDVEKLQAIHKRILDNNFSFDFVYRVHVNKNNPALVAKVLVHPQRDSFKFFVQIEKDGKPICRQPIYQGRTTDGYFEMFSKGKWKGDKEFIIFNKEKEIEIKVLARDCKVEVVNKSRYDNPPYFQMMKAGLSKEENEKAYQDWLHSLPPWCSAAIDANYN